MLEALTFSQLFACTVILLAAYFIRGVAGFGSGLIAIPFLAFMLPLTIVVPAIVLLDYLASASQGLKTSDHIRLREIIPLLPFSVLGIVIALYLFKSIDAGLLSKLLGGFLILFAIYTLLNVTPPRVRSRWVAVPSGLLGGAIGALFGTGGPLYVIYLKLRGLPKPEFRATFAAIFLLDGFARIGGYVVGGMFVIDSLLLVAAALPLMVAGVYAGGHVHTSISHRTFERIISVLLLVSGTVLIFK